MFRVVVFLIISLVSQGAGALCREPIPKLCQVYFRWEAVFRGTVQAIEPVPDPEEPDELSGHRYHFLVSRVYKGSVPGELDVFTILGGNTRDFERDREYIVFANFSPNDGWYSGSMCDDYSFAEPESTDAIEAEVLDLQKQKQARMEFHFVSKARKPLSAVPVTIHGPGGIQKISDPSDFVAVPVPPGKYRIDIPDGYQETPAGLESDFLGREFSLEAGQCAQVDFMRGIDATGRTPPTSEDSSK